MEETTGRVSSVVLVALQGDASDAAIVSLACTMARERNALLQGLYVVEIPHSLPLSSWDEETEDRARRVLDSARKAAERVGCRLEGRVLPTRDAAQAVIEEATEVAADVVVLAQPFKSRREDAALHILDKVVGSVLLWRPQR